MEKMKSYYLFAFYFIIFTSVKGETYSEFIREALKKPNNSVNCTNKDPCRLIKTKLGNLIGTKGTTIFGEPDNLDYCKYLGIRYAKHPVGDLRFKPPMASGAWNGTLNATGYKDFCISQSTISGSAFGYNFSEDCLFLNVYTPNPRSCKCCSDRIPVMIFIHGGGFISGSGFDSAYRSNIIMNKCVILVTLNYRIDIFGFLTLNMDEFPGNMGLYDQALAIKWVKENIASFGGDPNRITLFGESAGGASVSYQSLNEKSRENFNQIITMSSTAANYYAHLESNNHTEIIIAAAAKSGITIKNETELNNYLQNVDRVTLLQNTAPGPSNIYTITFKWGPVIQDPKIKNPFITRDPIDIMKTKPNKVPTVLSFLTLEFLALYPTFANPTILSQLNNDFTFPLPYSGVNQESCKVKMRYIFDAIRGFYFGNTTIGISSMRQILRMHSDMNLVHRILLTYDLLKKNPKVPVKLHVYDPWTALNIYRAVPALAAMGGAHHTEDLLFLFDVLPWAGAYTSIENNRYSYQPDMEAYQWSQTIVDLYVKYATYGIPGDNDVDMGCSQSGSSNKITESFEWINNSGQTVFGTNQAFLSHLLWTYIDREMKKIEADECNQ